MLMKNTQNPPFLHVKRENTRKTGTKMVENTLFSQIDKILKIYPRLDEYISFPFVPGSRTGFKRLCGHILVSSKGDQTYYNKMEIFFTYPSAGPLDHCNMVDISRFTCSGVFLITKTHE